MTITARDRAQSHYLEAYRSQVTAPFGVTAPNFEEILMEEELKELSGSYLKFLEKEGLNVDSD
jgi:hypothetical protein